ncbi:SpoIIIAH-like family protein [Paenibacillus polymyxa]|uniref:SpoIIIAH-like family protein n=1 Tax=Paenibacillus polymyxa TaxID=1406 RepID=UPI00031CB7E6|nr:SpoIIIAH-like family protein [Paenibacillus polymyxa]KAE8557831.1 10-formyltetrahydrofolate dehydrogenase [Paenibacillus polymyxa]MCJ1219112.1 SpoIIIAH-like family protein [Paenibacillus polymyxa]MDU8671817.1 SpoIIIAH-like family protein [Paenibacillus polymyxa]MDU8696726.1 SpoIIIAH-like family protein [Paenibacillus polymyxa]NMP10831.1 SpoIIIAH-like family protein [Paenibacillus polymyxa]
MNNKRQTVWLVSMLSLMVVLSAYYLFTEDSSPANPPVADSEQVSKVKQDAAQEATTKAEEQMNELKVNEVVTNGEVTDGTAETSTKDTASTTDPATEPSKGDKDTAAAPPPATESTASNQNTTTAKTGTTAKSDDKAASSAKTDKQVLDQVANEQAAQPTAAAVIDNYLLERDVENQKKNDELTTAMNDSTPQKAAEAQKELHVLEDKQAKITGIEEELQQQFANAVVREEDADKYKVVVLSEKLDAKQAVTIVDKVMKELNVTQDKISVQYVTQ